jgi:hypothetical protein
MWEEHKQRLENWVISEILTRPDLTERTLTLKKFIDIARVRTTQLPLTFGSLHEADPDLTLSLSLSLVCSLPTRTAT